MLAKDPMTITIIFRCPAVEGRWAMVAGINILVWKHGSL